MSRCGASPRSMEKDEVPELGSSHRPMDRTPVHARGRQQGGGRRLSHPNIPYCMSRCGASPNMMKKELAPLSGGPPRAIDTIPTSIRVVRMCCARV